jgi:predicted PurR-regulated permease PerM
MFQRLRGLLLIIRGLTPILIVLVVAALGSIILNDLSGVLQEPVSRINTEITHLQSTIETTKQDFKDVSDHVTTVVDAISSVKLPDISVNIPTSISIPAISIPSVSVPIPTASVSTSRFSFGSVLGHDLGGITYPSGISIGTTNRSLSFPSIPAFSVTLPGMDTVKTAVNDAVSGVKNQFSAVSDTFSSIGTLSSDLEGVNTSLNSIVMETQSAMTSVGNLASKWASALLVAVIVILVLVVIYTFSGIIEDLSRGWNLLLGRPAS